NRVADDITVAPEYLEESNNQAWARGGAGDRLPIPSAARTSADGHPHRRVPMPGCCSPPDITVAPEYL
ncbi:hypothetical protein ACUOCP_58680, partial [Escherichia sp. R-CC3]